MTARPRWRCAAPTPRWPPPRPRARAGAEIAAADARLAQARDRHERLRRADTAASAELLAQAAHEVAVRAAEAAVAATGRGQAEADLLAAQVERDAAALGLARCRIAAPVDGIVLRLAAAPGRHLSLDSAETALVAELFDPRRVQVRADVALADAGAVRAGQQAEIECDLLPGRILAGTVAGVAGTADAARNTLQVHIAIADPPPALRPDMLARVRILGDAAPAAGAASGVRLLAPADALRERDGERAVAWAVDADSRLRRRELVIAGAGPAGWVAVSAGVQPGEPLVLGAVEGLREGRRVDPAFGGR